MQRDSTAGDSRRASAPPSPGRGLVGLGFRLGAVLVPLALVLVAAEVGIRLAVPAERWRIADASQHWQIDPELGWVQQPGLDSYSVALVSGEPIRLRTNADGLLPATATRERRPEQARILLVGDSTIVGTGVEEAHRIHNALAAELAARGIDADVVNAGTEGFATDQSMLRLERLLGPYRPDVVLHCVCANDLIANELRHNHGLNKPSFRVDDAGSLAANPFEPSDRRARSASGPRDLIQHSAVYRLLRPRLAVVRARLGGWEARHLIGLTSDWYHDPETLEKVDWRLFGSLVERMRRSAAEHGAAFAVYLHPDAAAVWDPVVEQVKRELDGGVAYDRLALERRVAAELERRGIAFLPLVDHFLGRQDRGPFHLPRDPHCNVAGYRLQAERLAELLTSGEPPLLRPPAPGNGRSAP